MPDDRAVLAPADPGGLIEAYERARTEGMPLVLGTAVQQAATFGAAASRGVPQVIRLAGPASGALVLAATSGTGGRSKFVPWSDEVLDYQATATALRMGTGPDTRYGLALSPISAYGFSVVNLTRRLGGSLRAFAATDHVAITRALLDGRIDTLDTIPGVWRYLATTATGEPALSAALRRLTVRGVGGEVVPHALLDRYEAMGAPLHNGYGLTEAGPNVSISCGDGYGRRTVGTPLSGTDVRVREDGGVLVRGPGVAGAVFTRGQGAAPDPAVGADGWLDTGDIGALDAGGRLTIVGRASGLFAGHGRKVHATVIEETVRDLVSEETDVVALQLDPNGTGTPRVVIALVGDAGAERPVEPDSRQRGLPVEFRVRDVVHVCRSDTARTASGKLDRNHLAALVTRALQVREEEACERVS